MYIFYHTSSSAREELNQFNNYHIIPIIHFDTFLRDASITLSSFDVSGELKAIAYTWADTWGKSLRWVFMLRSFCSRGIIPKRYNIHWRLIPSQ